MQFNQRHKVYDICKHWFIYCLMAILLSVQTSTLWAGATSSNTNTLIFTSVDEEAPSQQSLATCPDPGLCFTSQIAKDKWAAEHKCQFKEVVCEDLEQVDNESFVSKAAALIRFADGLIDGLKQQLGDLWDFIKELFTNPSQVWEGIKTLAKLIIEDPKAAWEIFKTLLGDDINKLLKCGAYDQGRVIGKYVSPFFVLKVVNIVAKGGKLVDAVNKVKKTILAAAEKLKLGIKFLPNVKMPNGASWFDEIDIKKRGVGIENGLGNNTPDTFPVVDIIDKATGEVTSIKSKSPASAFWDKPYGLRDSIKTDIRKLADFTEDGKPVRGTWEKGTPNAGSELKIEKNKIFIALNTWLPRGFFSTQFFCHHST